MGYIRHNAIIVTSWDLKILGKMPLSDAHEKAREIFGEEGVSPVLMGTNGYGSFFIPPDGSNEGWPDSDKGDERRTAFIEWADAQRYEDGSTSLDWVEVSYGENGPPYIVRHSDDIGEAAEEG